LTTGVEVLAFHAFLPGELGGEAGPSIPEANELLANSINAQKAIFTINLLIKSPDF
jgi:hypothetical protein